MIDKQGDKASYQSILDDESQTNACAMVLAKAVDVYCNRDETRHLSSSETSLMLYFSGEIGAAKSCFIRAFLRAQGVTAKIKSPTFSIIETYDVADKTFSHMDLYRIEDEDELHYIGFEEYYTDSTIMLIEWPEKVTSLPKADLHVHLNSIDFGEKRKINIQSISKIGKNILQAFQNELSTRPSTRNR
tara:strand:+ start:1870 stop:2433 length:564 start_codon:yes stop_codon:yes gene_type:complete